MAESHWVWQFDVPPPAVWAVMADTARFNEAANFPKYPIEEQAQPDGSVRYMARARMGGFDVRWREVPVEWIADRRFVHCREFDNGPFRSLCATLELSPEGAGTRADYSLVVEPRNVLGRLLLKRFFTAAGRTFLRLVDDAKAHLAGQEERPFQVPAPVLPADTRARVNALVDAIEASPNGHGLARRLAEHALGAGEVDVRHIRPLTLARLWNADERHVIEVCLEAARTGLLAMEWDLLCPRCRAAKTVVQSLDRLPEGGHCASCNVQYDRDFARNVELSFHPAPAVRALGAGEFCLFGPMTTPHVKLQQTLAPGESRTAVIDLPFGGYRLRTLHPGGEIDIDWSEGGFPEVVATGDDVLAGPGGAPGEVRLTNRSTHALTLIVEERQWVRDALTAHRVTAMQAFRDLFSSEVLRPGDEVGIERVALMFTDLQGSTALYARIGDARAYHLVREHFAYLAEKVRRHNGAVIKTIGDAVMASFADPADALRAALDVQRHVAAFNEAFDGEEGITIKLGLHQGPTIAVTLNDRLDYFGSTVNLAARLQGESVGGDIVLSPGLAEDPAVAELLAPLKHETRQAALKGIDGPVIYWRLAPEAIGSA